MINPRELAKVLIKKGCSPGMQQKIRKFHSVYQITHNRHFREPEMEILRHLISKGSVVADVGANVGVYTHELSRVVGSDGKVYSFEPVFDNFEVLSALVKKAQLQNVVPFKGALGAKSAECEMVIPKMDGFTEYYWAHVARPGDEGRREKVEVLALDDLYRKGTIKRLNFMKCDVEGAEMEVIRGGSETIRAQKPGCLLEVSKGTSDDVFRAFKEMGFRAFVLEHGLVETEHFRDKEFSNYFFFHPASETWKLKEQASSQLRVVRDHAS